VNSAAKLSRWRIQLLWTLQGLFGLRVLGQVYAGLYAPHWLPSMPEWYSGIVPYPVLLPAQIVLLMFMTIVSYDNSRQAGRFCVSRPTTRRRLAALSLVYALVMVARYGLTMYLVPEARWSRGVIPIGFHFVLAAYVFVLSRPSHVGRPA